MNVIVSVFISSHEVTAISYAHTPIAIVYVSPYLTTPLTVTIPSQTTFISTNAPIPLPSTYTPTQPTTSSAIPTIIYSQ